jgi:hypothetical protein
LGEELFWLHLKSYFKNHSDNTNLYEQFKDLIGEIYTAEVHHVRQSCNFTLMMKGIKLFAKEKQFQMNFANRQYLVELLKAVS